MNIPLAVWVCLNMGNAGMATLWPLWGRWWSTRKFRSGTHVFRSLIWKALSCEVWIVAGFHLTSYDRILLSWVIKVFQKPSTKRLIPRIKLLWFPIFFTDSYLSNRQFGLMSHVMFGAMAMGTAGAVKKTGSRHVKELLCEGGAIVVDRMVWWLWPVLKHLSFLRSPRGRFLIASMNWKHMRTCPSYRWLSLLPYALWRTIKQAKTNTHICIYLYSSYDLICIHMHEYVHMKYPAVN